MSGDTITIGERKYELPLMLKNKLPRVPPGIHDAELVFLQFYSGMIVQFLYDMRLFVNDTNPRVDVPGTQATCLKAINFAAATLVTETAMRIKELKK